MREPSLADLIEVISRLAVQEDALHATLSNPAWVGVTTGELNRIAWRARCLYAARAALRRRLAA